MPSFKLLEAASNELDTIQSVLIIGAGLTGLTAAIRLRQANFKVTVLERSPTMQDIGAGIQIPPNCSRVLEGLGVLQKIKDEAIAPRNLIIRSQEGDELHNQIINSDDYHGSAYPHLVIHRADFIRVLYEEALELGAHIQLDARVDYVDFEAGSVKLLTGTNFTADIILGADGEHSICRKLLQGPKNTSQSSGNMVYRVMVPASVVALDPDLHCLINPGGIQAWYGPGSHLICYQLDRDDSFNVVLTLPAPPTGAPTIGPQPADINVLREYFHDWDPRLQKLLELTDQAQCWTLHEHKLSDKWVHPSGRFILLGDAAHPILPYM
ncbi:hypothetical protein N7488_005474 [Penicillium malachiteum]|nr:hypothetical protein N7488_005474 [Penicillium malachiteum]